MANTASRNDLFDNPMGTDGFEFVEYTAPDAELLRTLFEQMGFPVLARHRSKNVTLHRQGDINFIINSEPDSAAQAFARQHGPSVCAMAFRVKDATQAFKRAVDAGAKVLMPPEDMFWGDRLCKVGDRWGNGWTIAQHVKDLTPAEMQKAQDEFVKQMQQQKK